MVGCILRRTLIDGQTHGLSPIMGDVVHNGGQFIQSPSPPLLIWGSLTERAPSFISQRSLFLSTKVIMWRLLPSHAVWSLGLSAELAAGL